MFWSLDGERRGLKCPYGVVGLWWLQRDAEMKGLDEFYLCVLIVEGCSHELDVY